MRRSCSASRVQRWTSLRNCRASSRVHRPPGRRSPEPPPLNGAWPNVKPLAVAAAGIRVAVRVRSALALLTTLALLALALLTLTLLTLTLLALPADPDPADLADPADPGPADPDPAGPDPADPGPAGPAALLTLALLTLALLALTLLALAGPAGPAALLPDPAGRALAHALVERLHAAGQLARLVERGRRRIGLGAAERGRRVGDLLLHVADVVADLLLEVRRVAALHAGANHRPRIANLVAQPVLAHRRRRFGQLP